MDRYDIEQTLLHIDPVTASEDEIRQLLFHMKEKPHYVMIAYRSDHTDTCRNCYMGSSNSDHQIIETDDLEYLITTWGGSLDFRRRQETPLNYSDYEVTLYQNGVKLEDYESEYQRLQGFAQKDADARAQKREEAKKKVEDQRAAAAEA
ncbi:MAG: hypothetical protein EOP84_22895, partial [Verrucomicrobiaceae bacterium]